MAEQKKIDEDVSYFVPDMDKGPALRAMARTCFADTFGHLFDGESFEQFLDEAYGDGGSMSKDLLDSAIEWLAAETGGQIVGYAKLRPVWAPVPNPAKGALELQQIYVLRDWQGRGVAQRLMHWALDRARALDAPEIYLTVFDHNERAKRFYIRHGFVEFGRCPFHLGGRTYDDRVWRKTLS
jgi:diamine N-acetyltransferase